MRFWNKIISKNLSHEKANELIKDFRPYYTTREEWDGVHFYNKEGQYCILFKDGHVEVDMFEKAWAKDKNDWMIVTVTENAVGILKRNNLM